MPILRRNAKKVQARYVKPINSAWFSAKNDMRKRKT